VALAGAAALRPLYRTDIQRLHRRVRADGAVIEIALDRGEIVAGRRRLAVDEIEFELISGPPAALPTLAARWATRFGLWWDVRSKSEQGHRLALGLTHMPPVTAAPVALAPGATPAQAWQAMLKAALAQALPNAAEIAGGLGGPEHLHQLRVALRRLRSVLRIYAPWGGDAAGALALDADWRAPFAELGAARDRDVLASGLAEALVAAGAPPYTCPAGAPVAAAADVVRGAAFNALLLRTLVLVSTAESAAPADAMPLRDAARSRLLPLWRRVRREARAFAALDAAGQHRLRKRLKRLRYALEPLAPLLKPRPAARWRHALAAALEALGELNDLDVARALFRAQADIEPAAWFAVGYVAARRDAAQALATARLAALAEHPLVWRGR
jgi:inorganic triphosphatase YgiF